MENEMRELAHLFASSGDPEFIEAFLRQLLTPAEAEDIGKRWKLVKMLDEGKRQRQIAETLHLSLCKITRGSRELKKENNAFRRALEMLREHDAS